MDPTWITTSYSTAVIVLLTAIGVYVALILFTRIAGLRSFSKMSSVDFAVTIIIGALGASVIIAPDPPLLQGLTAIASLFLLQIVNNFLRHRYDLFAYWIDNKPLLLMQGSKILDENLKKVRVNRKELRYKLREANITQLSQVKAVVMETTGDITVLHHDEIGHHIDKELLKDVNAGNIK